MSNSSSRRIITTILSATAILIVVWISQQAEPDASTAAEPSAQPRTAETPSTKWYRGNLHTHSLWSDGDDYPEMIARWYRSAGYDFLVYTDHNVLHTIEKWIDVEKSKGGRTAYDKLMAAYPENWVEQRERDGRLEVRLKNFEQVAAEFNSPEEFLLIQGEEITDRFQNLPVHMNATNVGELIPPLHGDSVYQVMQNNVNAAISQRERLKQRILIHLNHPNFGYGVTAEDLMKVVGENFFEVYNGHPGVRNSGDSEHASTERIWDIILTQRIAVIGLPLMYGLATDDGHNYHKIPSRASEPGRGWVMVQAQELSADSLIEALEAGRFYSSSGVSLASVTSSQKGLEVEVEPEAGVEYVVEFIGTRKDYDDSSRPVTVKGKVLPVTRIYSDDVGAVLKTVQGTSASYKFAGDELYVRARVTSTKRHPNPSEVGEFERAWVQPLRGPAAPEAGSIP